MHKCPVHACDVKVKQLLIEENGIHLNRGCVIELKHNPSCLIFSVLLRNEAGGLALSPRQKQHQEVWMGEKGTFEWE